MVHAIVDEFKENIDPIMHGKYQFELLKNSRAGTISAELKKFARKHVYRHRSVLEVELQGHRAIHELMRMLWKAISAKREYNERPFDSYVNSRMSDNYRRIAEDDFGKHPVRYKDCQLLTDTISGMTDGFAIELCHDLRAYN
jgi:dGTPase